MPATVWPTMVRAPFAAIFFFLLLSLVACGSANTTGNASSGPDKKEVERWTGRKITGLENAGGILTPRVVASPGKNGDIHLAYFDGNPPVYGVNYLLFNLDHFSPPVKELVLSIDNSSGISLAVDSGGVPAIAYQGGVVREAGAAMQSDAMFSIRNANWSEHTGGIGFVERNNVFKDGLAGSDLSVSFDSMGDLHMVYQFRYEGIDALNFAYSDLFYIKKERIRLGDKVPEETVEGNLFNPNGTASLQNNVGAFCVVSMDKNDLPVVFYYAETDDLTGLKAASRKNGKWVSEWIETGIKVGGISRGRLDRDGRLGVAYFVKESQSGERNYLQFARQKPSSSWAVETVDDSIQCGQYPSLSFDSWGYPAVAYYAARTYSGRKLNDLRFSRFNGSLWRHEDVATDGVIGLYNTLWFDEKNMPVIVTYSRTESSIFIYSSTL